MCALTEFNCPVNWNRVSHTYSFVVALLSHTHSELSYVGVDFGITLVITHSLAHIHSLSHTLVHAHAHTHIHTPDHSPTAPSRSVDKLSPMRLVNLVKGNKGEETLAEINRKMQRALEEALMKNIHLHKVSVCGERRNI